MVSVLGKPDLDLMVNPFPESIQDILSELSGGQGILADLTEEFYHNYQLLSIAPVFSRKSCIGPSSRTAITV